MAIPTLHDSDVPDEVTQHREDLSRARRAGIGGLLISLLAIGPIALVLDVRTSFAVLPVLVLVAISALRLVLRPRPLRSDPSPSALRRVQDGTALLAVEGLPPAEARLALLDELDALKGRPDASQGERLVRRFGSVAGGLGTVGWATAGVAAAFMGASMADLAACFLGTALFGTCWFFIERERKKEREASRILRERLEALDVGSGEA